MVCWLPPYGLLISIHMAWINKKVPRNLTRTHRCFGGQTLAKIIDSFAPPRKMLNSWELGNHVKWLGAYHRPNILEKACLSLWGPARRMRIILNDVTTTSLYTMISTGNLPKWPNSSPCYVYIYDTSTHLTCTYFICILSVHMYNIYIIIYVDTIVYGTSSVLVLLSSMIQSDA